MNIDKNCQNYSEKKNIRFKSTKQSNICSNKIDDVKNQLNSGRHRQKSQGNCLFNHYLFNLILYRR